MASLHTNTFIENMMFLWNYERLDKVLNCWKERYEFEAIWLEVVGIMILPFEDETSIWKNKE